MKTLITLSLAVLFCSSAFSQKNDSENAVPVPDAVYILDSVVVFPSPRVFQFDDSDSYLQISGNYAVMSYLFRGKQVFYSGTVHNSRIIDVNGVSVIAFTVRTDNRFSRSVAGKRIFIGVSADNAVPVVYELTAKGGLSTSFTTHIATAEELTSLRARSE